MTAGARAGRTLAVDLAGAHELTLEAAFGSGMDASGTLADWAEARVTK